MRCSNQGRFRQQVRFLQRQFLQDGDLPFTDVLSTDIVSQALTAASVVWKDRIYTPLVTLWVFLGLVLNEEQRHKLEELMLKLTEGNLNEEQIKKTGAQLQEFIKTQGQKTAEVGEAKTQETKESRQAWFQEVQQRVDRGLQFANRLPPSADAHYVGKGISFGAANTPIFWYWPKDSKDYRVIYADLSVRNSDTPPNGIKGQPTPAPSGP